MSAPEVQIALANAELLGQGDVLLVGFDRQDLAEGLATLGARVTSFDQNLRIARSHGPEGVFGAWLTEGSFDAAAVVLPKDRGRLDLQLSMVRPLIKPGGHVFVAGHNDAGARSAGKHLGATIGPAEVVDYRFHSRLLRAPLDPAITPANPTIESWATDTAVEVDERTLSLRSYPGVFAHRTLDAGTRMLLEACDVQRGSVLDMGCGSGALSTSLALRGATVHAVDVDALAVLSAEQTLAANSAPGKAWASDAFGDVEDRYDAIVCNPPFHAGIRTTASIADRIITGAPEHLTRGGAFWMVANRFLEYTSRLKDAFEQVDVIREDSKFRVFRAH